MGQSKDTTGVQVMASPMAAVVEYALMKDYDHKSAIGIRPAAEIAKIRIPLVSEMIHWLEAGGNPEVIVGQITHVTDASHKIDRLFAEPSSPRR